MNETDKILEKMDKDFKKRESILNDLKNSAGGEEIISFWTNTLQEAKNKLETANIDEIAELQTICKISKGFLHYINA